MTAPAQPDLLAGADVLAVFSGHVKRRAETRAKVLDPEGHAVPVLCVDIECDGPTRALIHVEQPFPFGQQREAEQAARRFKSGVHVTVEAPLTGVRLVIPNAVHIRTAPEETAP